MQKISTASLQDLRADPAALAAWVDHCLAARPDAPDPQRALRLVRVLGRLLPAIEQACAEPAGDLDAALEALAGTPSCPVAETTGTDRLHG